MKWLTFVITTFAVWNPVYSRDKRLDSLEKSQLRDGTVFEDFPRYEKVYLCYREFSFQTITAYLKSLAVEHNEIVQVFSIGRSFEGRDIMAVKIANSKDAKPSMVIDAGIHANEWIVPTTALYIIHELVENKANHYLFEHLDFYIIPSLNPDGYEYTHHNASTRMWKKTRSIQPNVTCIGVDANRNFDMQWMTIGASSNTCSNQYAGPAPFSEPEATALRDFVLSLEGSAKTYITLCAIAYSSPLGIAEAPKTAKIHKCVADSATEVMFKIRGSTFKTGSSYEVLYPLSGCSRDWAVDKGGVETSYTVGLTSRYGMLAPPSEIIPVGQEIFEAVKIFAKHTRGFPVC